MSNVGYDLDTSGGLMPLIRALIKPPDEELNVSKSKKPQHPYYKRPGKGHNHDSCDACGEGGDLICCDRCPASFHLGCYDPPLDENDIPAGLWLCRECRGSDAEKPASSRSSRAQSPADNKSDTEKKIRSLRTRVNSLSKKKSKDDKDNPEEETKEEEKELSPMEVLVKAARIMNPRQFELPREMRIPCLFPGTEKEGSKNGNSSLVTVDAWGCVPLPAKSCYVCQGTCKMAPLLQCDYCPLLYHQDCLDPPLTALPTGRWMCPNHVEQYIDWKLVNSISATERVALWDKFSGPVDQQAIKIDFIRRARNHNRPFRMKVPVGVRGRVVVPGMVRHHYANPPPLLPSRREYVRCLNVLKNLRASGDYSESSEEEGRKHRVCMNVSCPQYEGGSCPHIPATEDLNAIASAKTESESSELSDSDFEYLTAAVKRRRVSHDRTTKRKERLEFRADGDASHLLAAVEHQLNKLDERLVKLLAWQRLQQVLTGEQCAGAWRRSPLSAEAEAAVCRSIDRSRLTRYGFRRVALPSELLPAAERERIARLVWGAPPPAASLRIARTGAATRATLADRAWRAALTPVLRPANGLGDGLGRALPMRLSSLTVGTDSGCDLVLQHPQCRCLSNHHATIFADEVSQQFELINYSEWGSRVNGVVYTCDLSRPVADQGDLPGVKESESAVVKRQAPCPCSCWSDGGRSDGGRSEGGAWEGAALVPHGALLQFGCLMFVFSVAPPSGGLHRDLETP